MKLLTFLGATQAHRTTYQLDDGRGHTACYCGVALARFHPDSEMRVLVTPEARAMHLDAFAAEVEDHVASLEAVSIPDGRREADLWDIFQAVVAQVEPGDRVIFDITHGFRSLPFLSFLAAAYLRVVRGIVLEAVYYGNFELRDRTVEPNCAPVVNLTRFVDLLDWTLAADRFVRQGDAQDLADRLRQVRPDYKRQQQDAAARRQSLLLSQAASEMTRVSQALQLLRPAEAMDASAALPGRIDALAGLPNLAALPFGLVAEQVKSSYAPFGMDQAAQQRHPVAALRIEREMVRWHIARGHYTQAVGLAREWLVSWVLLQAGFSDPLDAAVRDEVEGHIQRASRERRERHGSFGKHPFATGVDLHQIPQIQALLDLFMGLGDLRNDIMHAGKRRDPGTVDRLAKQIATACARLDHLPLPPELDRPA